MKRLRATRFSYRRGRRPWTEPAARYWTMRGLFVLGPWKWTRILRQMDARSNLRSPWGLIRPSGSDGDEPSVGRGTGGGGRGWDPRAEDGAGAGEAGRGDGFLSGAGGVWPSWSICLSSLRIWSASSRDRASNGSSAGFCFRQPIGTRGQRRKRAMDAMINAAAPSRRSGQVSAKPSRNRAGRGNSAIPGK